MESFDLVGGELSSANVKVRHWTVSPPPEVAPTLIERSRDGAFRLVRSYNLAGR